LLTIAAPAGPSNIANLQLALIYPLLDWINLMTYDFSVASSHKTNFVAPLFTQKGVLNVDAAVNSYLGAGVPSDKIVMGVRFVGTGWQGVGPTNNGLDQPNSGPAPGTWDLPGRRQAVVSAIRTSKTTTSLATRAAGTTRRRSLGSTTPTPVS